MLPAVPANADDQILPSSTPELTPTLPVLLTETLLPVQPTDTPLPPEPTATLPPPEPTATVQLEPTALMPQEPATTLLPLEPTATLPPEPAAPPSAVPTAETLPTAAPVEPTAIPEAPATPAVAAPPVVEVAVPPPLEAPTFRIFATREGLVGRRTANGHRIRPRDRFVALPSWSVLSSRGGHEFQVRVTYRGRSAVLPVWDVGPWNTRDDYWSPNRRYSDLPVGMPMAQAAREQGYNGGRDEFGRRIRMPNGIDIADGAFWDDLGMTHEDWVEVTFLWLGEDPVQAAAEQNSGPEEIPIEPEAVLVDDGAATYTSQADIALYDANCGTNGRHYWTYGAAQAEQRENHARWSPTLPGPGFYEVLAYIPKCGQPATRSARYKVFHDGAVTEVPVDQNAAAGRWASLGVFHMNGDTDAVELDDVTGEEEDTVVRFDAIKFVPRSDSAPPEARVVEVIPQPDGSMLVRWKGTDDLSGIASFDIQVRRFPDGGWSDWQMRVSSSEASFVPPGPGAYAFRARARDWASREQPWRESDDLVIGQ